MSKQDNASMQPAPPHVSRPRLSERETRVPAALWDRVKFVVLLLVLWACGLAVVWTTTVNPIGGPFSDAVRIAMHDYAWILVLLGLEVLRQLHYLIEEHSKAYYRFWQKTVFGGLNDRLSKLDDWTRFRAARAFKLFVFLFFLSCVLGRIFKTEPVWLGLLEAPARLVAALPFVFQLMFGFLFIVVQFGGLFWFLSRGGIDTYMPDDIETRFSDVKGQDPVLERVQENMIFLDDPESIEERGRLRARRSAALGSPGNGQDADGAGRRGRDREAVRVRRSRRVRPDVHGRRHPEGEEPLPEAPQARRPLRRRDRVLRRGRLPGEPRLARRTGRRLELRVGRRLGARPRLQRPGLPHAGHPRHASSARRWGPPRTRSSWAAWAAAAGWARCRRCCRRCPA